MKTGLKISLRLPAVTLPSHGKGLMQTGFPRRSLSGLRPEDLGRPFGQFGVLKDIYLPKDYYTGAFKPTWSGGELLWGSGG
ncbi:hypothetical protein ACFX1X_013418 [Malus domestica]